MDRIKQPDKESVREWLRQRQKNSAPLPDNEQIRRELGWKLVEPMQTARLIPEPA